MDLTSGDIGKSLRKFAIPILLTNMVSMAYGLIDTLIVSRFAGAYQLSISSSANALVSVGQCLVGGASAAVSIMIGHICGSKDNEKLNDAVKTIMIAGSIFAMLIAVVYFFGTNSFLKIIHLPDELVADTAGITYIYVFTMVVQLLATSANGILHGAGDSRTPLIIISISQIANIILDWFAVALLDGGAAGAAWASVISLCGSYVFMQLAVNRLLKKSSAEKGRFSKGLLKEYTKLGIPSILQQSVMSIGSLFLQNIVNMAGMEAINGYTIAVNLNNFLLMPIIAYTTAYETFAAQCFGAKMPRRAAAGYRELMKQGMIICLFLSFLTIFTARPLVHLYLPDSASESYTFACAYLWILIPNYFLLLLKYGSDAVFKADMKVIVFTISSFISLFIRIIVSYLMVGSAGLSSLAWATMIGNLTAYLYLLVMKKRNGYFFK